MKIGPYVLPNNLFLAPMAGVTDAAFRRLCLSLGAGYAASEMISSDTSLFASEKTVHRVQVADPDHLHAVQIVGSDPGTMAAAARLNVEMGAQVIDINMGCPAKKVCRKLAGSALLADENLVSDILQATVTAVDVPVTLKIRTGPSPDRRNALEIARRAEQAGIVCLAVHGRTRSDKFLGDAEYDTIARIKQHISIPVVANGDITDPVKAAEVLEYTGVDGLMIGRAAQGNPFIFRQIDEYFSAKSTAEKTWTVPTSTEIKNVLCKHLQGIYNLYGEYKGVRIARKHISWYCKSQRNAAAFRARVNLVESSVEQLELIESFFDATDSVEHTCVA